MGAIDRRINIEANLHPRDLRKRASDISENSDTSERIDSDPAWAPNSKTLAVFSSADKGEQRQLWSVNADGSDPKKLTSLNGYAARPRWSHNGKQIAFLYIEGAGGGGPLMAAPTTTGVIDTAIHNQRIAVLDVSSGQVRQVSPDNLHIYDFDWSPDDNAFVERLRPDLAITIGGSRRFTRSTSQKATRHPSTNPRCKLPSRAGRPMASRSHSSKA